MNNITFYKNAEKHLGENGTKTHDWYGMGGAWCCMFISKCYAETVKSLFYGGKKASYCPAAIKWCAANQAQLPLYLAMAGDTIFFDWNNNKVPDHIGMIMSRVSTSTVATLEGNTGSPARVRKVTRPAKYVLGIFRPHFTPEVMPAVTKLTVDGQFDYASIYLLQKALGLKQDCILGKDTVKALQKKAGTTADGAWGKNTSKAVQKIVGTTVDGEFGINSVKALQTWINSQVASSEAVAPTPVTPTKSTYTGAMPDFVALSGDIISNLAKKCAWPVGTAKKKYAFLTGSPFGSYKAMLNKAYPNRTKWSKRPKAGSSCDVFVGTIARASGADTKYPRGLAEQIKYSSPTLKAVSNVKRGDIVRVSGHTLVVVDINGVLWEAEASYGTKGEKYSKYPAIYSKAKKSYAKVLRCNKAIRSYLKIGDTGAEVKKLQAFLKWYGYKITVDGEFGQITQGFVKLFQSGAKITVDGQFGAASVAKAKTVER